MRKSILLLAFLCLVLPLRPARAALDELLVYAPADATVVAGMRIDAGWVVEMIAGLSLSPGAFQRVMSEQLEGFGKESGIHVGEPLELVIAASQERNALLLVGKGSFDVTALEAYLKTQLKGVALKRDPDGPLMIVQGEMLTGIWPSGLVIAGKTEDVKKAVAAGKERKVGELATKLTAMGAGDAAMIFHGNFPKGIPGEMGAGAADPLIAESQQHVRQIFAVGSSTKYSGFITFDSPATASKIEPKFREALKRLSNELETAAAKASDLAASHGANRFFEPQWLSARIAVETFKDLSAALTLETQGPEFRISMVRDTLKTSGGGMLSIAGIGVLAAIAVPNFKAARERANFRACFANQKTIAGATEMYMLDKNVRVEQIDPAHLQALVSEGYLQHLPSDPGQGPDSEGNYYTVEGGNGIACRAHGDIQGTIPGTVPSTDSGGGGVEAFLSKVTRGLQAATQDEWKACIANQKTIVGAMEMYNLDQNKIVSEVTKAHLDTLKESGYLQQVPTDPGQGADSWSNYYALPDGNIACKVHGDIKGSIQGSKPR